MPPPTSAVYVYVFLPIICTKLWTLTNTVSVPYTDFFHKNQWIIVWEICVKINVLSQNLKESENKFLDLDLRNHYDFLNT